MDTFPNINPWYNVTRTPKFVTHIAKYRNLREQRISRMANPSWKISVHWDILNATDCDLIKNFFISMRGAYDSFYFYNKEDDTTYTVRFETDLINLEYFDYMLYSLKQINFVVL